MQRIVIKMLTRFTQKNVILQAVSNLTGSKMHPVCHSLSILFLNPLSILGSPWFTMVHQRQPRPGTPGGFQGPGLWKKVQYPKHEPEPAGAARFFTVQHQPHVNLCQPHMQLTSCQLDRLDMYVPETTLRSRCTTARPAWHLLSNFDHSLFSW